MKISNILLSVLCLFLVSCAQMGLKPHKPSLKSTQEISKSSGAFRILAIKGETPEVKKMLESDLMSCGTTTFSMPRGNTVSTFIREIYEEELIAARKFSENGEYITVLIKSLKLDMQARDNGAWYIDVDFVVNGKTTNIKTTIDFSSKVSILTSCTHTASVFEDIIVDSFVDFFIQNR